MANAPSSTADHQAPADPLTAERDLVISTDAVIRASGILGLVGVAVIHFSQVVDTIEQTAWLGVAFVALTLLCAALAGRLLNRSTVAVWAQVAVLNLAAIGGFVFTRVASTGFDNQDVGNWSENLGLAALLVEVLLVALSLYALTRPRTRRQFAR